MKIRIIIEYDPDWTPECIADEAERNLAFVAEQEDWLYGRVELSDLQPEEFKFEIVEG